MRTHSWNEEKMPKVRHEHACTHKKPRSLPWKHSDSGMNWPRAFSNAGLGVTNCTLIDKSHWRGAVV